MLALLLFWIKMIPRIRSYIWKDLKADKELFRKVTEVKIYLYTNILKEHGYTNPPPPPKKKSKEFLQLCNYSVRPIWRLMYCDDKMSHKIL